MNNYFFHSLGLERAEAQTWPRTYSIVGYKSFFAQQVNNRASASWKKAEYIYIEDQISEATFNQIRAIWRNLYWRNQFLIVNSNCQYYLLNGRNEVLISGTRAILQGYIQNSLMGK